MCSSVFPFILKVISKQQLCLYDSVHPIVGGVRTVFKAPRVEIRYLARALRGVRYTTKASRGGEIHDKFNEEGG